MSVKKDRDLNKQTKKKLIKMNPNYNQRYSKCPPNYHQPQGGMPLYCINAYAYPLMNHMSANMIVNQTPFQRTFASVVSCEKPNFNPTQSVSNEINQNSGIFNSFIKRLTKQPPPPQQQPPQQQQQQQLHTMQNYPHKEFEDFTKIPTVIKSSQQSSNFSSPPPHFVDNSQFFQPPPPPHKQYQPNNHNRPRNNFFHTIMGNFYPQQQQQHQNHQQQHQNRWGFRGFRCNRNRPQHRRFHYNDAKNVHEKERTNIERDIKNDYCDIAKRSVNENQLRNRKETANNNNQQLKCDKDEKNPPFEIFSLEEFPAITSTINNSDIMEQDFVSYRDDAAATTPTYTPAWPKRISLCEKVSKIVKSPQKLLALPTLATPRRSCLKPTPRHNRSMSECSDDFIVFERVDDKQEESDEDISEEEDDDDDDDDSEMSDEDTIMEGDDEVDEAMDREDESMQCDQQPDSGIEEKKVRNFNNFVVIHF